MIESIYLVQATPNQYWPNYSYVLKFENEFVGDVASDWMQIHWYDSFYLTMVYLVFIFIGRIYMTTRLQPYKLKFLLTMWNLFLAVFSIVGSFRTWPELIHVLKHFGFQHSVCRNTFHRDVSVSSFWTFLFALSKAPELLDTVFVVLRKQRLIFLHWYHHATVLIFTWYCYADAASTGRWYANMNYSVHAIMYSYYGLKALGFRIPRKLAMCITISQITQMLVGTYVTFYAYYIKRQNQRCDISFDRLYAGMAIYISYFLLFANFFARSYLGKKTKKVQ